MDILYKIVVIFMVYIGADAAGNCQSEQWECQDGGCITLGSRCDSLPDCTDQSDEQNCTIESCNEGQISCGSTAGCISVGLRCDGTLHCPDGSDEEACSETNATESGAAVNTNETNVANVELTKNINDSNVTRSETKLIFGEANTTGNASTKPTEETNVTKAETTAAIFGETNNTANRTNKPTEDTKVADSVIRTTGDEMNIPEIISNIPAETTNAFKPVNTTDIETNRTEVMSHIPNITAKDMTNIMGDGANISSDRDRVKQAMIDEINVTEAETNHTGSLANQTITETNVSGNITSAETIITDALTNAATTSAVDVDAKRNETNSETNTTKAIVKSIADKDIMDAVLNSITERANVSNNIADVEMEETNNTQAVTNLSAKRTHVPKTIKIIEMRETNLTGVSHTNKSENETNITKAVTMEETNTSGNINNFDVRPVTIQTDIDDSSDHTNQTLRPVSGEIRKMPGEEPTETSNVSKPFSATRNSKLEATTGNLVNISGTEKSVNLTAVIAEQVVTTDNATDTKSETNATVPRLPVVVDKVTVVNNQSQNASTQPVITETDNMTRHAISDHTTASPIFRVITIASMPATSQSKTFKENLHKKKMTSSTEQTQTHSQKTVEMTTQTQLISSTSKSDITPMYTSASPTTEKTTTDSAIKVRPGKRCFRIIDTQDFCRRRYRGSFRHVTDCTRYYVCDWGFLHVCRCPQYTRFDIRIHNCNWEYFVPCDQ